MLDIKLPAKAPMPVVIPEIAVIIIAFKAFIPPFFSGSAIEIPSGISCIHIDIASDNPKVSEAEKPLPIAKPSGKLWIVRPRKTINPVCSNLFFV